MDGLPVVWIAERMVTIRLLKSGRDLLMWSKSFGAHHTIMRMVEEGLEVISLTGVSLAVLASFSLSSSVSAIATFSLSSLVSAIGSTAESVDGVVATCAANLFTANCLGIFAQCSSISFTVILARCGQFERKLFLMMSVARTIEAQVLIDFCISFLVRTKVTEETEVLVIPRFLSNTAEIVTRINELLNIIVTLRITRR